MTAKTRDSFPDVLRGFALLGIALVNIPLLAIDTVSGAEAADLTQTSNSAAAFLVWALFQSKFYLLFSFLFGYSAHYVIKGDRANRGRWVGRSIGLILLGVLHLTFFFHGDILFLYGMFGLLLLALYFRTDKTLKVWSWVIFGVSALLFAAISAFTFFGEAVFAAKGKSFPIEDGLESLNQLNPVLLSGSFLEAVAARVELWLEFAPTALALQGPLVFVAFLVGVLVARRDGLSSGANPQLMKRFVVWGFTLGLALQLVSAYLFVTNAQAETYSFGIYLTSITINFFTAPLLSAGYVGALWLIAQRVNSLGLLSAAGRHSLTIYLSQSLVFSLMFSAYGFGLFAKLGVAEVTLIAIATWLLLALLAMLNLRFRSRGPMEALLTNFSKLFERKS
jgi:uncharacterized protein